jgi:DNA-binding transcriptional MerR regulator
MLEVMSGTFSPSQAAEQSGFSLDTLRYYERIGLLDGIDHAPSGHRQFRDEDLEWLGVLRCLAILACPSRKCAATPNWPAVGRPPWPSG